MQSLKLGPPACDTKLEQARWQSQVGEPISQMNGATLWLHFGGAAAIQLLGCVQRRGPAQL